MEILHLDNLSKYVPHEVQGQTALVICQKNYCKVFWKNSKGIVEQAYPDIPFENDNQERALLAVRFQGVDDKGLNRCFVLNKDLDTYDTSMKDFNSVDIEFKKMLKKNPDKRFLQFAITAGHGMCKDGGQWILMNEISQEGFYKMFAVEKTIRSWSDKNSNCYFIALFAGCREVHRYKYHINCISANSQAEAKQKIQATEEEAKKKRLLFPPTMEELIEEIKQANTDLKEKVSEDAIARIVEELKASRGE